MHISRTANSKIAEFRYTAASNFQDHKAAESNSVAPQETFTPADRSFMTEFASAFSMTPVLGSGICVGTGIARAGERDAGGALLGATGAAANLLGTVVLNKSFGQAFGHAHLTGIGCLAISALTTYAALQRR